MKVIAERLGEALQTEHEHDQPGVVGRRQQQPAAAERAPVGPPRAIAAVSATCSITSLAHTRSNALSASGSGSSIGDEAEVQAGMARLGSAQRRLRHIHSDHLATCRCGQRREVAGAAADVEHAVAWMQLAEQQTAPECEVRRLEFLRQVLPQLLVVSAHLARRYRPRISRVAPRMTGSLLAITPVDAPGGAETTLLRLLSGLRDRDWQITLTTPGAGPLREQALAAGFRWDRLPLGGLAPRTGGRALASWPLARRLSRGAQIVYLNGGVCGRVLPALGRRGAGRPAHPRHGQACSPLLATRGRGARGLAGRRRPPATDSRPHVVYPPADPDPPAVAPPWPTGKGPVVGFVGRLEPRKGPLDLVRAAPAIRRVVQGTRIVMVGGEPYGVSPAYTREVLRSPAVEHYPWSDNAPGLMRHLDVLVLPSYEEPAGTVLAEAMAVGTPVVATRVNGLPEVVRDGVTGRLVEPGDIDGLASAVSRCSTIAHAWAKLRESMRVAFRPIAMYSRWSS